MKNEMHFVFHFLESLKVSGALILSITHKLFKLVQVLMTV